MTELSTKLQSLVKQAATETPTKGRFSEARARLRSGNHTLVVLADVSTSMAESAGSVSKHQMLKDVLTEELPEDATLLAFNSRVTHASPESLPSPRGSTALHLAFEAAEQFKPGVTFVISDGHPDDRNAALRAARALPGVINILYTGPDDDAEGRAFMLQLAGLGAGRVMFVAADRKPALKNAIRELRALPST